MTETKTKTAKETPPKEVGPLKMRAVQDLFGLDYDEPQTLTPEGHVFRYKGPALSEQVAVEVDPDTPLGAQAEESTGNKKPEKPNFTSEGFVKAAQMAKGAAEGGAA